MYRLLPPPIKKLAVKNYYLWNSNTLHPSLHFKCINPIEGIWSARVGDHYRAVCFRDPADGCYHWFWIDSHEEYNSTFC